MIPIDSLGLYEIRMLVFVETNPQSGKYRQLHFSKEQFKAVSDAIAKAYGEQIEDGRTFVNLRESIDEYNGLPDVPSYYTDIEQNTI